MCSPTTATTCEHLHVQMSMWQTSCETSGMMAQWSFSLCIVACSQLRRYPQSCVTGLKRGCGSIAQRYGGCGRSMQLSTVNSPMSLCFCPYMWARCNCNSCCGGFRRKSHTLRQLRQRQRRAQRTVFTRSSVGSVWNHGVACVVLVDFLRQCGRCSVCVCVCVCVRAIGITIATTLLAHVINNIGPSASLVAWRETPCHGSVLFGLGIPQAQCSRGTSVLPGYLG